MPELSYLEAIRAALAEALEADERVFLLGEDIGTYGGVYKATDGLFERFGPRRVIDTPIAENAILGMATGAALVGMRPVAEIQFADFLACALDPLANMTSTIHYRWGQSVPLVVRAPAGATWASAGPFHSQSPEAWFAQIPGLKVVMPATPADAKGLLTAAIRDDDPVVFIESASLYAAKGPVPEGEYVIPLGTADVKRAGSDVTLITYGKPVHDCLEAAAQLAGEVDVEVLDLRSVVPWDAAAMLESVSKTRRAIVVHQAVQRFGVGAEIAAWLGQELFGTLAAPVLRVGGEYTPVPYAPGLEAAHLPSAARVVDAVRTVCKSG